MRIESYETVADWPIFNGFVENCVVSEHDQLDDWLLSESRENVLHWLSQGL